MTAARWLSFSAACLLLGGFVACAAGPNETLDEEDDEGAGGSGGDLSVSSSGGGVVTVGVGGGTGGSSTVTEVFGHSAQTLYRLDPVSKQIVEVGAFSGCSGGVLDIALDKNSRMLATTSHALYEIDRTTADCTLLHEDDGLFYPNSLSFVPEGTLDASEEALVGYAFKDYVRIDPDSGGLSTITVGALEGDYESSGDIVSVIDGATYLTIKFGGCDDCLVEINPVTGTILKHYGDVGYAQIFGVAYWGGRAYGFSKSGELFEVTFGTNNVASIAIPIAGAPPGLEFWGAGSATSVPVFIPE